MKQTKRILSLLLAIAMVLSMAPAVSAESSEADSWLTMFWGRDDGEGWFLGGDMLEGNSINYNPAECWTVYFCRTSLDENGEPVYEPVQVEVDSDVIRLTPLAETDAWIRDEEAIPYLYNMNGDAAGLNTTVTVTESGGTASLDVTLVRGEFGFYSSSDICDETYLSEFRMDHTAEENAFYFSVYNSGWNVVGMEFTGDDHGAAVSAIEDLGDGIYKIILNPDWVYECCLYDDHYNLWFRLYIEDEWGNTYEFITYFFCTVGRRVEYLSHSWLINDGDGWYTNFDEQGQDLGMTAYDEMFLCFYYNHYNENGEWVVEPAYAESQSDLLTLTPFSELEYETIRADQEYGEYFYVVSTTTEAWDQTFTINAVGNEAATLRVTVSLPECGFYTTPDATTDSFVQGHFPMDPNAEENVIYFIMRSDHWTVINFRCDEAGAEAVSNIEYVDRNIYKITIDPDKVQDACVNHYDIYTDFIFNVMDPERNVEQWYTGISGVPAAEAEHLSISWINNDGDGWYVDEEIYETNIGMPAGQERWVCFYYNHYDENGDWVSEPVHVVSASDGLFLTPVTDMDGEQIREDQANGDCFYRISTDENAWNQTLYAVMEGNEDVCFPVYTRMDELAFYSEPEVSTDYYLNGITMDPGAEEYVVYFGDCSEYWNLVSVSTQNEEGEDLSGADRVTLTQLENGMYEIRISEPYNAFYLELRATVEDSDGNQEQWWTGIWCDSGYPNQIAYIDINHTTYIFFEGSDLVATHVYTGQDEFGNDMWELQPTQLPDGVSYDVQTNTLTLENANLSRLGIRYCGVDTDEDGNVINSWFDLPSQDFTIRLIGENTITADPGEHALNISEYLHATITGDGSLRITKDVSQDGEHTPPAVNMWEYGTLTIEDSASVTVEVQGEHYWTDEDGNTSPSDINVINGSGTASLTVRDNASLITVIPENYLDSLCTYRGIDWFESVTIEGGYVEAVSIGLGGSESSTYTQTGGEVVLKAQVYKHIQEDGSIRYDGNSLVADGQGVIDISGGKLSIDVSDIDTTNSWINGIITGNGTIRISGGEIDIKMGPCGTALNAENNGGRLEISGGSIRVTADEGQVGSDLSAIRIGETATATISGGTMNATNADITIWGESTLDILGGEINIDYTVADNQKYDLYGALKCYDNAVLNLIDGNVTVNATNVVNGIDNAGTINQSGGTLYSEARHTDDWRSLWQLEDGSYEIQNSRGMENCGTINLSGGDMTVIGQVAFEDWWDENQEYPSLTVTGGTMNAIGVSVGIQVRGNITLAGGSVNATASAEQNAWGFNFYYASKYIGYEDAYGLVVTGGNHRFAATNVGGSNNLGLHTYTGSVTFLGGTTRCVGSYGMYCQGNSYVGLENTITIDDSLYLSATGTGRVKELLSHYSIGLDENGDPVYNEDGTEFIIGAWFAEYDDEAGNIRTDEGLDPCTDLTITAKPDVMLEIVTQPESVTVAEGEIAQVSLEATGEDVTYEWYYSDNGGETFTKTRAFAGNTYRIVMNSARDGRMLYCVVTDIYGNSAVSETVTISMEPVPALQIIRQPESVSVAEGEKAVVDFEVEGDDLTYEWYYSDNGGESFTKTYAFQSSTYYVPMTSARDGRMLYCVVTDIYGNSVTTETVTISMLTESTLEIITQPVSVAVAEGEYAVVTVEVQGDGLTYQWYFSDNNGTSFNLTSAFTGNTYKVAMTSGRNGRMLYCVITDQYGNSVTTETVTISMLTSPSLEIITQPVSVAVAEGENAVVTVEAQGEGLTYAWYYADAGSTAFRLTTSFTSNTYRVVMTAARSGRQVYCVITDADGNSVQTDTVTISMLTSPSLEIITQPVSVAVAKGENAVVTVEVQGEGLTYEWYFADAGSTTFRKTASFTGNTYSVAMNESRNGRRVYCVITDADGNSVQTDTVTISMLTSPSLEIITQPVSVAVAEGENAVVTVEVQGEGLTYEWYFADAGSTTFRKTASFTGNTYSVAMNESRNGRRVYCVITDADGNSVQTDTVTISMISDSGLVITQQPVSVTVAEGEYAVVTVEVQGEVLSYEWYYAESGSDKFYKTSAFTGNTYKVAMTAARSGRRVYCVITGADGTVVTTEIATISMA